MKKVIRGIGKLVYRGEEIAAEPVDSIPSEAFDAEGAAPMPRAELNHDGFPAIFLDEPIEVDGVPMKVELGMDKIRYHDANTGRGKEIPKDAYESLHEEIRVELGRRIARLTPTLDEEKQKLLLSHTVDMLHRVAKDQTARVRRMLAEEMSDMPDAHWDAVKTLAWDEDVEVARSILEHSPMLKDDELIDLIRSSNVDGVTEAIARRNGVDEPVTGELVKTGHPPTIQTLLENETSHMSEETLNEVIAMAPEHEAWHVALCERNELTQATINRIGEFVSRELVDRMKQHADVPQMLEENARLATSARLRHESVDRERDGWLRALHAHEKGTLDAEMVDNAIHSVDRYFVVPALGFMSEIDPAIVKRIIASRNPKVILALAHQAKLSARVGYALQMKIANVPHPQLLHPRGGTDYPISEEEMETYLDIFVG